MKKMPTSSKLAILWRRSIHTHLLLTSIARVGRVGEDPREEVGVGVGAVECELYGERRTGLDWRHTEACNHVEYSAAHVERTRSASIDHDPTQPPKYTSRFRRPAADDVSSRDHRGWVTWHASDWLKAASSSEKIRGRLVGRRASSTTLLCSSSSFRSNNVGWTAASVLRRVSDVDVYCSSSSPRWAAARSQSPLFGSGMTCRLTWPLHRHCHCFEADLRL